MANLGSISTFNINGNEITVKDPVLTEVVEQIITAIGANNNNIAERINDLHSKSFDYTVKITNNNELSISNVVDGIYKIQYVTSEVVEEETVETLVNSAIMIQENNNQYLYKDGQVYTRAKTNNTWETWSPHDYSKDYLTFEAIQNTSFAFTQNNLKYSLDNGVTWTTLSANTSSPTINPGDKILWKQSVTPAYGGSGMGTFSATGNFKVYGNIMSLYYEDDFIGQTNLAGKDNQFSYLFYNNYNLIDASNLILPATTLSNYCYSEIFQNCTSLINIPKLTATTLTHGCYNGMFSGCTSLTTVPELPATTLAERCYASMFKNCTSLTKAPELPATTLAERCYANMFKNCTSLTKAPELPATTLTYQCYASMFSGCTSLAIAPELPAPNLINSCYNNMFDGCTSLNYVKCLATNVYPSTHTDNWLNNVAASGTFIKDASISSWITGSSGIPSGWDVYTEDKDEYVKKYEINITGLPTVTSSDNGKILMVINGQWALVSPSLIYTGEGVPNNIDGNNGDLYIQTD